jgi:opacity protein-like surface antigen
MTSALEIQLKLAPGLRFLGLDEVHLALAGWENALRRRADFFPGTSFESGGAGSLGQAFDFEAEALLSISRWFKLGLSVGYIYASREEEKTALALRENGVLTVYARPTIVSGHPLLLAGYLGLPVGRKFSLYGRGGLGIVLARYSAREAFKTADATRFSYSTFDSAKAQAFTYLGGIGLSYAFEPNLGFFLEAVWEYAKVGGFSGESGSGESGALYSFEEYKPDLDFWQVETRVSAEPPGGAAVRNVREATIDFSGYSVKIGVILKF